MHGAGVCRVNDIEPSRVGRFEVTAQDPDSRARCGLLYTVHGAVETPLFLPVGTYGAVRSIAAWELEGMGFQMLLANTYHLA